MFTGALMTSASRAGQAGLFDQGGELIIFSVDRRAVAMQARCEYTADCVYAGRGLLLHRFRDHASPLRVETAWNFPSHIVLPATSFFYYQSEIQGQLKRREE